MQNFKVFFFLSALAVAVFFTLNILIVTFFAVFIIFDAQSSSPWDSLDRNHYPNDLLHNVGKGEVELS